MLKRRGLQRDVLHLYSFVEKELCRLAELFGIFGSKITASGLPGASGLHVGMALKIVGQTGGHIFSLRHHPDSTGNIFQYLVQQQGIVCATKDDAVYLRVMPQKIAQAFLHEIVGTRTVELVVFDQRHPHGTRLARDHDVGIELLYFQHIGS